MTIGYDDVKARCVGTFVGTMMTTLWVYDGMLDVPTDTLKLFSDGPSFIEEGARGKYMDVMELPSDEHRVFNSYYLNAAGEWERFMTTHYHRTKQLNEATRSRKRLAKTHEHSVSNALGFG